MEDDKPSLNPFSEIFFFYFLMLLTASSQLLELSIAKYDSFLFCSHSGFQDLYQSVGVLPPSRGVSSSVVIISPAKVSTLKNIKFFLMFHSNLTLLIMCNILLQIFPVC